MPMLCDVALFRVRLDELTYDYAGLGVSLAVGDCVEVRLRGRKCRGVVTGLPTAPGVPGIKPVERLVEPGFLGPELLKLTAWLADYYCCPLGEALAAVLPEPVRRGRAGESLPLVPDRERALPGPAAAVPFSVEVSVARTGRQELVAEFLAAAVERGGGILLLPEAQLDAWLPGLRRRFGPVLTEYHSRLGPAGLKQAWRQARGGSGQRRLVVGVRSAVFAPLKALGGIAVVDTHDPVFKEERYPRYNARDLAVVRARMAGCPVLFSDPVPAVETWHSITGGQYRLRDSLPAPRRYPASYIVNIGRSRDKILSARLRRELERIPGNASAVLYVNRKGLSRRVACAECGAVLECPECQSPMVLTAGRMLVCGWCSAGTGPASRAGRPAPEICPRCGGASFDLRAAGVDLVARELGREFPERDVVTVAGDKGRSEKGSHAADKAATFPAGALVVGTRALLGIPWPDPVGLVAVVNLDYELSLPDYHVRERAFTLLSTLVGRAEASGAVLVVQTRQPDEPLLDAGLSGDVEGFMTGELELRRAAGLPPWQRLAVIELSNGTRGAILTHAARITRALNRHRGVELTGPADGRQQRVRLLVRFPRGRSLGKLLDRSLLYQGHLRVRVDVDPLELF